MFEDTGTRTSGAFMLSIGPKSYYYSTGVVGEPSSLNTIVGYSGRDCPACFFRQIFHMGRSHHFLERSKREGLISD